MSRHRRAILEQANMLFMWSFGAIWCPSAPSMVTPGANVDDGIVENENGGKANDGLVKLQLSTWTQCYDYWSSEGKVTFIFRCQMNAQLSKDRHIFWKNSSAMIRRMVFFIFFSGQMMRKLILSISQNQRRNPGWFHFPVPGSFSKCITKGFPCLFLCATLLTYLLFVMWWWKKPLSLPTQHPILPFLSAY